MPTGYTADVGEGKVTDFPTFALRCARAMGALVMMRDDPWDAPIPERFEPSGYHAGAEAKARAEFERLSKLSLPEILAEHRAALDNGIRDRETWDREAQDKVDRYREMLAKVRAWEPPTPEHDGLKRLMVEQLETSIEFDGPVDRKYLPKISGNPEEWHLSRLAEARRNVTRTTEEHRKEVERTESRNRWVAALRESLSGEPSVSVEGGP